MGSFQANYKSSFGKLLLVGVPIGNYEDLSMRGLAALKSSDLILCEDTRETQKLLLNFGIVEKKLISYMGSYDFACSASKNAISNGHDVVVVSDRGMPCISDPGAKIVNHIKALGFDITCIPGPSAVDAAFCLSGYSNQFIFHGFLPRKDGDIKKICVNLEPMLALGYNLIFFQAPNRLEKTFEIFQEIFSSSKITLARELTKTHEQILEFAANDWKKNQAQFKGECVIIIKA